MDNGRKRRAASALVQYARSTFEKDTEENNLVAPISPSPTEVVQTVIDGLGLETHDVVLDLGCGDGRWLIAAALKGCHGRGFDLNKDLLEKGCRATAEAGVSSLVKLAPLDMFDAPLKGSTVIIVYLFREGVVRMKRKLEKEADPGARVVSVGFQIRGWMCLSTVAVGGLNVYVYRVPDQGERRDATTSGWPCGSK